MTSSNPIISMVTNFFLEIACSLLCRRLVPRRSCATEEDNIFSFFAPAAGQSLGTIYIVLGNSESEFGVRRAWSRLLHVNNDFFLHCARTGTAWWLPLKGDTSAFTVVFYARRRYGRTHALNKKKTERHKREKREAFLFLQNPDGFEDEEAKSGFKVVFWLFVGTNREKSALEGRRAGRQVWVSKSGWSRRDWDGWHV